MVIETKGETIPTHLKSVDGTLEIGSSKSVVPVLV